MFDANEYRNFLLSNMPFAKPASGLSEVVCKCMYCPDDGDHHHMYISIPQVEGQPSKFNCFKCGTSGYVTSRRLIEWQIFDPEWGIILSDYNKSIYNNPLYRSLYINNGICNIRNTFIREDELSFKKLQYINDRLGLNLSFQNCLDNKIVLNINDLLRENYINKITRSINFINELNKSFVGFLSYDNNFINLRNMENGSWIKDRYVNYNIFGKEDNTKKMYTIPVDINLYYPIKVHIAEGPFDILSIKYNLRKEYDNNIYTAIAGNAYKGVLRELIINRKLINLEIHLYPDSDYNDYSLNDIINFIKPFGFNIFIHRNQIDKDMGVPINKISETIERV